MLCGAIPLRDASNNKRFISRRSAHWEPEGTHSKPSSAYTTTRKTIVATVRTPSLTLKLANSKEYISLKNSRL
jgi:hypothetical protein